LKIQDGGRILLKRYGHVMIIIYCYGRGIPVSAQRGDICWG